MNPTGGITVFTGTQSHGQGSALAQIVADQLGIDACLVEISHGDSVRTPFGMGTCDSRSAAVGGSAIFRATETLIANPSRFVQQSPANVMFWPCNENET